VSCMQDCGGISLITLGAGQGSVPCGLHVVPVQMRLEAAESWSLADGRVMPRPDTLARDEGLIRHCKPGVYVEYHTFPLGAFTSLY